MSVSQNYGVLRIVHMRPPADTTKRREKDLVDRLPEERLVHLLTQRETTIGRALSSDLILLDPTVSRLHARLVLNEQGWRIYNVTGQNTIYVNECPVSSGENAGVQPQDFLMLGNTVLQLIAPHDHAASASNKANGHVGDVGDVEPIVRIHSLVPDDPGTTDPAIQSTQGSGEVTGDIALVAEERSDSLLNGTGAATRETPPALPLMPLSHRELQTQRLPVRERFFKAGIAMQFALSRHSQQRVRWMIGGLGLLILFLSVLVILVLNNVLSIFTLVQDNPLSLLAIVTIPIIPALGINLLVNFMDRFEREPWFLRLAAFLWGAIIAIPPTLLIEQYVDSLRPLILGPHPDDTVHAIFAGLNAGVTEETVKGLGLLLLFVVLRDEFDNVTDGIIYGALIGAGFAMVENYTYFATHPKSLLVLLIGRVVLGWLSHSTFTACFGAALGYIRHTRVRWQHIVIPLVGYVVAVGLHSVFDFVNFFASSLVSHYPTNANVLTIALIVSIGNYLPPFIAQMVIIYSLVKSQVHEAFIIREFLAEEVSSGVVTVDEYALLQRTSLRRKIMQRMLWRQNWRQWMRVGELYQTEVGLAFQKWHRSMDEKPGYEQKEAAYRQRIQHLRQEIARAELAPQEKSFTQRWVPQLSRHVKGKIR
ncbi:MAG: hypothetical protein PVS3B1_15050 [Ktedonobacteraceae bacterium]